MANSVLKVLAGIALLLTVVGIFSVLAYTVDRRMGEFGVRMALGARQRDVLRLILGQSMKLTLGGAALGLAGALVSSRVLESMLYGVTATDPVTFTAVSALLMAVAGLAGYLPARRAARVDPVIAMRAD